MIYYIFFELNVFDNTSIILNSKFPKEYIYIYYKLLRVKCKSYLTNSAVLNIKYDNKYHTLYIYLNIINNLYKMINNLQS